MLKKWNWSSNQCQSFICCKDQPHLVMWVTGPGSWKVGSGHLCSRGGYRARECLVTLEPSWWLQGWSQPSGRGRCRRWLFVLLMPLHWMLIHLARLLFRSCWWESSVFCHEINLLGQTLLNSDIRLCRSWELESGLSQAGAAGGTSS